MAEQSDSERIEILEQRVKALADTLIFVVFNAIQMRNPELAATIVRGLRVYENHHREQGDDGSAISLEQVEMIRKYWETVVSGSAPEAGPVQKWWN